MVPAKIITLSNPEVVAISVRENDEPLVDLAGIPAFIIDKRKQGTSSQYTFVRETVANMLLRAQQLLGPIKLLIIEGHRPITLQKVYFDEYYDNLKGKYPQWSHEKLYQAASTYVSPPEIVPPHSTGGAIDLTLTNAAGVELNMGVPVNASPEESNNRCYTLASDISDQAKANRQLLINAMSSVGFVNFPSEFWHWSYGDKYWAYHMRKPHSLYGTV